MGKQQLLQQPALIKRSSIIKYSSGFTLIELIIVIAILGILSVAYTSISLPDNGIGIRLNSAANQVVTDIRLAQSLAMGLNQRRQVNFTASSYGVTDTNNNPAWLNSASMAFDPLFSITSGAPSSIIFNGRGVPYLNSTTPLASNYQIVLSAPSTNEQRTITVYPNTGSVGVTNP